MEIADYGLISLIFYKEGLYKVVDGTIGCTAMIYIIKHLLKHE